MAEQGSDCRSLFLREVQMFREMVHVDGEKAYKNLVKSIKEISLRFVDDLRNAAVPAVVRSIRRKDGQQFKEGLSIKYTSQADRFDPYAVEDEGWDEATQTLVSDIFQLAGSASETMSKVYGKINILRSKPSLSCMITEERCTRSPVLAPQHRATRATERLDRPNLQPQWVRATLPTKCQSRHNKPRPRLNRESLKRRRRARSSGVIRKKQRYSKFCAQRVTSTCEILRLEGYT